MSFGVGVRLFGVRWGGSGGSEFFLLGVRWGGIDFVCVCVGHMGWE